MSRCHLILDEIETGAGSDSVGRRLELLQNVTDLFVAGSSRFSGAEIALFDDILMRLTAEIESEARERLAQRLAALADAPPKLIRRLAFDDEIAVAAPVLTASPQLSDADLVENAARNSQHLLYAIAQRLKLSEAVTEVLIERGDRRVVRRAARNAGARFSLAGYERTVEHASRDRKLALTLGQRGDVPRQCYLKLLETASAEVRERLEAISPEAAQAIREAVAEVAGAKQAEAGESSPSYTRSARQYRRLLKARRLSETNVHGPARAENFAKTAIALSMLGVLPIDIVERALLDKGTDMILMLAKAAGWTTTKAMMAMPPPAARCRRRISRRRSNPASCSIRRRRDA
jgi:uncharacterized protein (DUF2336 family)